MTLGLNVLGPTKLAPKERNAGIWEKTRNEDVQALIVHSATWKAPIVSFCA